MIFKILFAVLFALPAHALIGGSRMHLSSAVYVQELKCSGVLIAPNVVLTAGHCLFKQSTFFPSVKVRDRVHVHASTERGEKVYRVIATSVDAHPAWRRLIDQHMNANLAAEAPDAVDLAFIVLDRSIPLAPARLAAAGEPEPTRLVISGWGCEVVGGPTFTSLKAALVDASGFGETKVKTETSDHWTGLLAGHCAGDSGGGGYLEPVDGEAPTLYSINSYLEIPHESGGAKGEVPTISVRLNAPEASAWLQSLLQ